MNRYGLTIVASLTAGAGISLYMHEWIWFAGGVVIASLALKRADSWLHRTEKGEKK